MSNATYERKEFDVTDKGCQVCAVCLCPVTCVPLIPGVMGTKKFILEPEEAVYEYKCGICNETTRRPYGELGSVDRGNCLCCIGVNSGLTRDQPVFIGWGCDGEKVDEVVKELKARMKGRGDTAVIDKIEQTLEHVRLLGVKTDLILQHHNIPVPVSAAPLQAKMG